MKESLKRTWCYFPSWSLPSQTCAKQTSTTPTLNTDATRKCTRRLARSRTMQTSWQRLKVPVCTKALVALHPKHTCPLKGQQLLCHQSTIFAPQGNPCRYPTRRSYTATLSSVSRQWSKCHSTTWLVVWVKAGHIWQWKHQGPRLYPRLLATQSKTPQVTTDQTPLIRKRTGILLRAILRAV